VSDQSIDDARNLAEFLDHYKEKQLQVSYLSKYMFFHMKYLLQLQLTSVRESINDTIIEFYIKLCGWKVCLRSLECLKILSKKNCNPKIFWKTGDFHIEGISGEGITLDSGICSAQKAFRTAHPVHDLTDSVSMYLRVDVYGHGTICVLISCGTCKLTGLSIQAGAAPKESIVMYKVTNEKGRAHPDIFTKALERCFEDKDRRGSEAYDLSVEHAIQELTTAQVLVVTASGNAIVLENMSYPCSICVGVHDEELTKSARL